MKAKSLLVLVVGWMLMAAQSWASSKPFTHFVVLADNGGLAIKDALGIFRPPVAWKASIASADLLSTSWALLNDHPSLDTDGYTQTVATSRLLPETASAETARNLQGNSDFAASLVLIGLGSALLLGYRWRMDPAPPSDPIRAR